MHDERFHVECRNGNQHKRGQKENPGKVGMKEVIQKSEMEDYNNNCKYLDIRL